MQSERLVVDEKFMEAIRLAIATGEKTTGFAGMPVYISEYMPKGTGVMLDSEGNVVKIFKLEESK